MVLGVIMPLVCISLHLSALVCISLHLSALVCISLHLWVLIGIGLHSAASTSPFVCCDAHVLMSFHGLRCRMLSPLKHLVFEPLFGPVFGVPVIYRFLLFGCHILEHSMRGYQHPLAQVLGWFWASSCHLSALVCTYRH